MQALQVSPLLVIDWSYCHGASCVQAIYGTRTTTLTQASCLLQVMFNHLLLGPPKCPKCLRESLQGAGLAPGTHRVLGCEEDFHVLHMKARCKGCPQHSAQGMSHLQMLTRMMMQMVHLQRC